MNKLKIKIDKCPYENDWSLFNKTTAQFDTGLTVLVGCNGAGKTTMLEYIFQHCKKSNIPVMRFDNYHDGGKDTKSKLIYEFDDMSILASTWGFSEGETINFNISFIASKLRQFIQTGLYDTKKNRLEKAFQKLVNEDYQKEEVMNQRVILLDGIDSGFSIDNIIETKELFNLIIDDAKSADIDVYIIVSANEYELVKNEKCFDVSRCKYCSFTNYEEYRNFIIDSRNIKDQRYNKEE